jgi:hypothetical protein
MKVVQKGVIEMVSDTVVVNEKLKKCEMAIKFEETFSEKVYTNYLCFNCENKVVDALRDFNIGDEVEVTFVPKSSRYEKEGQTKYFQTLRAINVALLKKGLGF